MRLNEDMHVHSTFSDGKNSIRENHDQAIEVGLKRLGCVDHVRHDTTWVPDVVRAVRRQSSSQLEMSVGLEVKLLDADGTLDVPKRVEGIDYIYAADHQFPLLGRCAPPREVREMLAAKATTPETLIDTLVGAYLKLLARGNEPLVLAHLFSILPRVGIPEQDVPEPLLQQLAEATAARGAAIEVDERWACPNARTVQVFIAAGVRVFASSDAHRAEDIGRYEFVAEVAQQLERRAA